MPTAHQHFGPSDTSFERESNIREAQQKTREKCRLTVRARDSLHDGLVHVAGEHYPLEARIPHTDHHSVVYDAHSLFYKCEYSILLIGYAEHEEILELGRRFKQSLEPRKALSEGTIDLSSEGVIRIRPGLRRVQTPNEEQVAEGLCYFQFASDRWRGLYASPIFYSWCIAPHLRDQQSQGPIDWALQRMKIVVGYSDVIGQDYNPHFAEHAYTQMAEIAGNAPVRSLFSTRKFTLTPVRQELYEEATAVLGHVPSPELAIFLMQQSGFLVAENLSHTGFRRLAKHLPQALENGLNIDRVSQLFRYYLRQGDASEQALDHVSKLVRSVFTQGEKPWWFKEDADLRPPRQPNAGDTYSLSRREEQQIAQHAGFAFVDARECYLKTGATLATSEGLDTRDAIAFCAQVAREYGIGNVARACEVIRFAIAMMDELAPEQRAESLELLSQTLSRHKPSSELIGILQGPGLNFAMPGIVGLLTQYVPTGRLEKDRVDALSVQPEHLRQLAQGLSRPLFERAHLMPAILEPYSRTPLLTAQIDLKLLPGPGADELPLVPRHAKPLSGYVEFEHQLAAEVPAASRRSLAIFYFAGCASKLPDPFKPPAGFLSLLHKLHQVSIPELDFEYLHNPYDGSRAAVRRENHQHQATRFSFLYNLLDTYAMGIVSWSKLEQTLHWIVAPLSAEEKKKIEVNEAWRHTIEYPSRRCLNEAEAYQDREKEIQARLTCRKQRNGSCVTIPLAFETAWEEFCATDDAKHTRFAFEHWQKKLKALESGTDDTQADIPRASGHVRQPPEDQELKDAVLSRIREQERAQQVERLKRLEGGMAVLLTLKEYVVHGALPARVLIVAWDKALETIQRGAIPEIQSIRERLGDVSQLGKTLEEMRGLQIIDVARVEALIAQADTLSNPLQFVEQLSAAAGAFREARTLIRESVVKMVAQFRGNHPVENIQETRAGMKQSVQALLAQQPLILPGAAEQMSASFDWLERYSAVFGRVQEFRDQVVAPRYPVSQAKGGEFEVEANIAGTNNLICTSWFALAAFRNYDQQAQGAPASSLGERQLPVRTQTRQPLLEVMRYAEPESSQDAKAQWDALAANCAEKVPDLEAAIAAMRRDSFGERPIGSKVHTLRPMDDLQLDLFKAKIGISSNGFRLHHANTSLAISAVPSDGELSLILGVLSHERILNTDRPEIQLCLSGRLCEADCAYLGAVTLLGTQRGVQYNQFAFYTSHDSDTDFRIMSYDKGAANYAYPFNSKSSGRTDIFGRRDPADAELYQRVGTVLLEGMDEAGPFAHLAEPFKRRFKEILHGYGIAAVLDASWIYTRLQPREPDAGKRHYFEAIRPCTDAWFDSYDKSMAQGSTVGIIRDTRILLDWLKAEVKSIQAEMLCNPRYDYERKQLLTLGGNLYV